MKFHYFLLGVVSFFRQVWADQLPLKPEKPSPIIYMIRHAEKPPQGPDGKDLPGLSAEGLTRAEALMDTFGKDSKYDIDFIIVEHPKKDGGRSRPLLTVKPLAHSLGLKINSSIRRYDALGVKNVVSKYNGTGNILICWEHTQMTDIAVALGVTQYAEESGWAGLIEYPHHRFDLIWVIPKPYTQIVAVEGEQVPNLDDGKTPDQGNYATPSRPLSSLSFILVAIHFMYALWTYSA